MARDPRGEGGKGGGMPSERPVGDPSPPLAARSAEDVAAPGRVRLATRRLGDLRPASYNPRSISDEAMAGLSASIERFGLVQPIVLNERTGRVVGGHQRLKALRAQGAEETDVILVDLPEAEEKALNLALNHPGIAGQFTEATLPLLEEVVIQLPELADDLRLPDLAKLLGAFEDVGEGEMPGLEDSEKETRVMNFLVHESQVPLIEQALERAMAHEPSLGGGNSRGNALAVLAERFRG